MLLSEKLTKLQETRYISPAVMAKALGYKTRQAAYSLFNGKIKVLSLERMKILCQLYNVPLNYFNDPENHTLLLLSEKTVFDFTNNTERLAFLMDENHKLWIENARLKAEIIELIASQQTNK